MAERGKTELEVQLDRTRGHGWRTELAQEMGVSRQVLHAWITGRKKWPEDRVTQLCALTGLDREGLFERS